MTCPIGPENVLDAQTPANRLLRLHVGPSGLASCLSQDQPPDARKTPLDPPQEHRAARVIRRFVERVEGRFEQRLGDERPVCRFTFVPVEELDGVSAHQQRTGLGSRRVFSASLQRSSGLSSLFNCIIFSGGRVLRIRLYAQERPKPHSGVFAHAG